MLCSSDTRRCLGEEHQSPGPRADLTFAMAPPTTIPAPQATAMHSSDNLAFQKALDAHLSTLLESEKLVFAGGTPEAALQSAAELDADHRGKSRLRKWAGVLTKLVNSLDQYLKVVDIMVSSRPEIAALVWGGLYFVIEVRATAIAPELRSNLTLCSLRGNTVDFLRRLPRS